MQHHDPSGRYPELRAGIPTLNLNPPHLPLNRTGLGGRLELERSSFCTRGSGVDEEEAEGEIN